MKNVPLVLAAAILALGLSLGTLHAEQACDMTLRPNQIDIGTTYNGATLSITGSVPQGCSVVIRMLGEREDEQFKQKGKAFGLLWMNMAAVTLHDVPGVVLLGADSETLAGDGSTLEQLGLGFDSFLGDADPDIFQDFIKLKERDEFYGIQEGVVEYTAGEGGARQFSAELAVPSSLRKGIYDVQVFAVRDGQVVCRTSHELHAVLTGLPEVLASVAFNHGLLYGILATVVAILAGLFMSLVFKDRGGAH